MRAFSKGHKFMEVIAEGSQSPVFSEDFLYSKMCKDDARFVLAVAEEYDALIDIIGTEVLREILTCYRDQGTPTARKRLADGPYA